MKVFRISAASSLCFLLCLLFISCNTTGTSVPTTELYETVSPAPVGTDAVSSDASDTSGTAVPVLTTEIQAYGTDSGTVSGTGSSLSAFARVAVLFRDGDVWKLELIPQKPGSRITGIPDSPSSPGYRFTGWSVYSGELLLDAVPERIPADVPSQMLTFVSEPVGYSGQEASLRSSHSDALSRCYYFFIAGYEKDQAESRTVRILDFSGFDTRCLIGNGECIPTSLLTGIMLPTVGDGVTAALEGWQIKLGENVPWQTYDMSSPIPITTDGVVLRPVISYKYRVIVNAGDGSFDGLEELYFYVSGGSAVSPSSLLEGILPKRSPDESHTYVCSGFTSSEGTRFSNYDSFTVTSPLKLTAVYSSSDIIYTLSFNTPENVPGDHSPIIRSAPYGGVVSAPTEGHRKDERTYYNLIGWRSSDGILTPPGEVIRVTADASYTAEWEVGEPVIYTATFITPVGVFSNGSSKITISGTYGQPIVSPEPPGENLIRFNNIEFTWEGWDTDPDPAFTRNSTHTANYRFDDNVRILNLLINGDFYCAIPYYAGSAIQAPEPPPEAEGKIFSSWDLPDIMPDDNLTADAELRSVYVRYMLDNDLISETEVPIGDAVSFASSIHRPGYTVTGWHTSDISQLTPTGFIMPANDVILRADSVPNRHTIFYYVDGILLYTDTVYYDHIQTVRGIEVREGYSFVGWILEKGNVSTDNDTFRMPDEDLVFTGSFIIRNYEVRYYIDSSLVYTDTYPFGSEITLRPPEQQEGCSFAWNSADVELSSGTFTMPSQDVVIVGVFSAGAHRITYYIDNELYTTVNASPDQTIYTIAAPLRQGYTFSGWSSPDTDISYGLFPMPDRDISIYGSFFPNTHYVYFIDGASGRVLGGGENDFGSLFFVGDALYCDQGRVTDGWVLIYGQAELTAGGYRMPDTDVIFVAVWKECLTLGKNGSWTPYFWGFDKIHDGFLWDENNMTVTIYDSSIQTAGYSEGVIIKYEKEGT